MSASFAASRDILEIGYVAFFKRLSPERTMFVAMDAEPGERELADLTLDGAVAAERLRGWLVSPDIRAIVVRVNHHPGPGFARLMRLLPPSTTRGMSRMWRAPPKYPRLAAPLVILDFEDEAFIHASLHKILPLATHIFKRELPVDRWRLLQSPTGEACDEAARRMDVTLEAILDKVGPLPLGLPLDGRRFLLPSAAVHKTADVFFAGRVEAASWPRRQGYRELETLQAQGVVVDMPSAVLEPAEFYRRCAAAWLVWSPPGYGWDCFRHYEAAACRSVPVSNYPTIERYEGLIDGVHALFHDSRPGALGQAVLAALADKPRLRQMGCAAREHVLQHHTPEAIAARILAEIGLST